LLRSIVVTPDARRGSMGVVVDANAQSKPRRSA
jgi:hypothetical protein